MKINDPRSHIFIEKQTGLVAFVGQGLVYMYVHVCVGDPLWTWTKSCPAASYPGDVYDSKFITGRIKSITSEDKYHSQD